MEGSLGGGRFSLSEAPWAPSEIKPAMEELQKRVKETLDVLSPLELRNFRDLLKKVDEEPRVTQVQLELEGGNTLKLAQLLSKHYYASVPRVLTKVLQQLPRADLVQCWQENPTVNGLVNLRKRRRSNPDCVDGDLDRYDLSGSRKAFLMCVKKGRPGADQDIKLMKQWLVQCQFEYTLCFDPGKKELIDTLTSFRDELNKMKDEISCCLVTLMSHGEKGFIKIENDDKVSLEFIFDMFNNKNCPALHEKPKIFIIQACRGERRDSGVETDDEPMDLDDISEKRRLPTFSDYFIIYPTQPDYVALRHCRTGSVMIQAMAEVFQEHGNRWHIADFFTKVNNKVVHTDFHLQEGPVKVSLVMESTLTRSVYF
ncbi:caspase-14-like [Pteronotus mesoamericanus]|uniref:caspase-14-like n=1 Tax=Pteronotus mesoamericanus TaxID=1884717 RepID=UPI0023EAD90C|nr:caspase-14-like [Pteronotus parnellii mesoamericanus]